MSTLHELAESLRTGRVLRPVFAVLDGSELVRQQDLAAVLLARNPEWTWVSEDLEPLPPEELGVAAHG